jgi:hypothetical protein
MAPLTSDAGWLIVIWIPSTLSITGESLKRVSKKRPIRAIAVRPRCFRIK